MKLSHTLKVILFAGLTSALSHTYGAFVASLSGGVNLINTTQSANLNYTLANTAYQNSWNGSASATQGVAGLFLGYELPFSIAENPVAWQFGLASYKPFSPYTLSGNTSQSMGGSPGTAAYAYNLQSLQLLFDNKFLIALGEYYYPYISLGAGLASNYASHYQSTGTSSLTFPMGFADNTNNSFSYEVGLGLDVDLKFIPHFENWRIGLTYRYVNLGTASLGVPISDPNGGFAVDNSIRLQQALSTQQILTQLTYIF